MVSSGVGRMGNRLLSGLAMLLCAMTPIAAAEPATVHEPTAQGQALYVPTGATADAGEYYLFHGKRIALRRESGVVAMKPATTAAEGAGPAALGQFQRLGHAGRGVVLYGAAASGKALAQESESGPTNLAAISASPDVAYAYPVLVDPATGRRLLLTDEIVVRLGPELTLDELTETQGLSLVRRLRGAEDEYILRLKDRKRNNPLDVANRLTESGSVLWAEPNLLQHVELASIPDDPLFPQQWHLQNTGQGGGAPGADANLPAAWDLTTGDPDVVIAIVDDAVDITHEDLVDNIYTNPGEISDNGIDDDANGYIDDVHGWNFWADTDDPGWESGDSAHGTESAGLAAARGNNLLGVTGVCQRCSILPVKIYGSGFIGTATLGEAIRYAGSLADVVNNSWTNLTASSAIESAVQWVGERGSWRKRRARLVRVGQSRRTLRHLR